MITHDIEAEKALMALPEGTPVKVGDVVGTLVFRPYPENYKKLIAAMDSYMEEEYFSEGEEIEAVGNLIEELSKEKSPHSIMGITEEDAHKFYVHHNCYEFGISSVQLEDENVSPRDIGKPSIRKGSAIVCYEYSAGCYEVININQ